MGKKRKVFIVEDHAVLRESYIGFIGLQEDIEVCGAAATAEEALDQLDGINPDLLLVDVSLPGMNGIEMLQELGRAGALGPAVVVSGHNKTLYLDQAIAAGARDFVAKQDGPKVLLETIRRVLSAASK